MLAWRSNNKTWVRPLSGSNKSRPMECQDDRGVHGADHGQPEKYAAGGQRRPLGPHGGATSPPGTPNYTIWNGNWLNWNASGGTVSKTRIEIVREVTTNLLESLNGVNVGLMHFNDEQGGTVRQAITNIATSRAAMQTAVNALTRGDLDAAVRDALRSGQLLHGPQRRLRQRRPGQERRGLAQQRPHHRHHVQEAGDLRLPEELHRFPDRRPADARRERHRPRSRRCRTGPPTSLTPPAAALPAATASACPTLPSTCTVTTWTRASTGLQNVTTYTIGFGVDLTLGDTSFLKATAKKGGGAYYPAGDTATLRPR